MTDYQKIIGSRITEQRKARGLSRADLAAACGLNIKTLGMYERGDRSPDLETLAQICRSLDTSADYIIGLEELPVAPTISAVLDPERLRLASQISGAVLELAQLDQYANFERDSLTPCGMILESLRALISDTDADYKQMLQQIPGTAAADPDAGLSDLQQRQQIAHAFEDRTLYRADQTARGIYSLIVTMLYKRLIGKPYDKTPVELPARKITVSKETIKSTTIKDRDSNETKPRRGSGSSSDK